MADSESPTLTTCRLHAILLVSAEPPQDSVTRLELVNGEAAVAQLTVDAVDPVVFAALVCQLIDLGQKSSTSRTAILEADSTAMSAGSLQHIKDRHL